LEQLSPSAQNFSKEAFEIIVTDDSPTGIARGLIEVNFPDVQWTKGPGKGPAANRNHGASLAKGEWLIFLDDDCIPEKQLIYSYLAHINSQITVFVFEGAIHPIGEKKRMDEEAPVNTSGGMLWSCNFCIKRSVFIENKGFNEAFPYACMEDVDLHSRLKSQQSIIFAEQAKVYHHWRRVHHISLKWKRVFESHKIFLQVNPNWREYFTIESMFKLLLLSFFKNTMIDILTYRGRGIRMNLSYHLFQIKMIFLLMNKQFFS
jgi:GT2 family glycosyltransferase